MNEWIRESFIYLRNQSISYQFLCSKIYLSIYTEEEEFFYSFCVSFFSSLTLTRTRNYNDNGNKVEFSLKISSCSSSSFTQCISHSIFPFRNLPFIFIFFSLNFKFSLVRNLWKYDLWKFAVFLFSCSTPNIIYISISSWTSTSTVLNRINIKYQRGTSKTKRKGSRRRRRRTNRFA